MRKLLTILFLFPLFLFGQDRLMGDSSWGAIEKGSNVISLTHNPGFQVGDVILIPTTKDRGFIGGGGAWPYFTYNTIAEMQADKSKVIDFYAGCLEDGNTYRFNGVIYEPYLKWGYYTSKIIPIIYRAKIVSISGNVLTMDKEAKASLNSVVYYDNGYYFNKLFNFNVVNPTRVIKIPKGRYATGLRIEILNNSGSVDIDFSGSEIFSPPGAPTACLQSLGVNITIHDLVLRGNFKDKGFGFNWWNIENDDMVPPVSGYWDNPYEKRPGIMLWGKNNLGYNLTVYNSAAYGLQVWNNSFIRDSEIILEDGIREYTGWQIHALGAYEGAGFRNIKFYSPIICNGLEAARSTDVVFDNITMTNGISAFNTTGGCSWTNSTVTFTKNSREGSFINNGHPFLDINGYMAIYDGATDLLAGGFVLDNVHFIQECFSESILRAISAGTGVENVVIKNSSYTRPNFTNTHSNQQAIFFESALNNTIENFTIRGIQTLEGSVTKYRSDITMGSGTGTGLIKNVTGAGSIIAALGVIVENSPVKPIINQACNVLALDPREKDTITRKETVLLFPNPADKVLNIKSKSNGQVFLYNSLGQKVNAQHSFNGQFIKIGIEHLPTGLYFIQLVRNREYDLSLKFIKK